MRVVASELLTRDLGLVLAKERFESPPPGQGTRPTTPAVACRPGAPTGRRAPIPRVRSSEPRWQQMNKCSMNDELEAVTRSVEELILEHRGALRQEEIAAVFARLRGKAVSGCLSQPLKMQAAKHLPELIGINLDHALAEYEWHGCAPVATNGIITEVVCLEPS